MSLKVYLAGGFYQEDDWRYKMVKGLDGDIPYEKLKDGRQKWGKLPKSILNCIDFIGPYPEYEPMSLLRTRLAIKEADFIFSWVSNENVIDISRLSFELGYASALEKIVGIGCIDSPENISEFISFAALNSPYGPHRTFYSDNPVDSFRESILYTLDIFPIDKLLVFRKSSQVARILCGDYLARGGYVYVIQAETGHYKIGRTSDMPNRMKLFAVKLPFNFDIVTHFPCEDMHEAEAGLHKVFTTSRTNGEWFSLNQYQADLLKSVTKAIGGLYLDENDQPIDGLCELKTPPWYTDEEFFELIKH